MKQCKKCLTDKQLSEFSVDRSKNDGLQRVCNDCLHEAYRARVARRAEQRLASEQIPMDATKVCKKCGIEKQTSDFPKASATIDGISIYCKTCHVSRGKQYAQSTALKNDVAALDPYAIDRAKKCPKCSEEKNVSEFARKKANKDGLSTWCRQCASIASKKLIDYRREVNATGTAIPESKICKVCGIDKSSSEFHKNRCFKDGLHHTCSECQNSINRVDYANNTDEIRRKASEYRSRNPEIAKKWALNNADYLREWGKKYRENNKPAVKERTRKWRLANKDRCRIHDHNRRAKKKGNGGRLSIGLKGKLFELQRGHCAICKIKLSTNTKYRHMDHVISLDAGGPNEDWNMQLLCQPCNLKKNNKDPIDFMQEMGYLI